MSKVWEYFEKLPCGLKALCSQCPKTISCRGSNTSGLIRHLETHAVFLKRAAAPEPEKEEPTSSKRAKIEHQKTIMDYTKREQLPEIVARLAAKDGFSIAGIEKSEFIRTSLLQKGMKLPRGRTNVMNLIVQFYLKAKQQVIDRLLKLKTGKLSLTLDEWTSLKNRRFLNINVHSSDGETINLGLTPIKGSCTAEKTVELVYAKLNDFSLLPGDIACSTTDGAKVMVKFGSQTDFLHQLCYNHGLHLAVCDVLYSDRQQAQDEDESDGESDDSDVSDEEGEDETVVVYKTKAFGIKPTLLKVRQIVKMFKRSPLKNSFLQEKVKQSHGKELELLLDVKTRWNSVETMLERFVLVHESVTTALKEFNCDLLVSSKELEVIKTLLAVLKPLRMATESLSARTTDLLQADGILQFVFDTLKAQSGDLAKSMYAAVLKRVGERRNVELVSLLRYLQNRDSNGSVELPLASKAAIVKFAKSLGESLVCENPSTSVTHEGESSAAIIVDEPKVDLKEQLAESIKKLSSSTAQSGPADMGKTIQRELALYDLTGNLPTNLQKLNTALKSIRPTSTESERVFADTANFCNKKRTSLKDGNLDMLTFLKSYFNNQA